MIFEAIKTNAPKEKKKNYRTALVEGNIKVEND